MVDLVFQMQEDFFGNRRPESEVGGLGTVLSSQIVACIVKNLIENRLFHEYGGTAGRYDCGLGHRPCRIALGQWAH